MLESDTIWTNGPIDLLLSRSGIIGAVNCPDGSAYPLYALSGSQTVTVNVIEVYPPNTAVLTPGTPQKMGEGDTLTFKVYPKYDNIGEFMHLRSPGWLFYPDSMASSPSPVGERIGLCFNDWSCTFTAAVPGTIKVYFNFTGSETVFDSVSVHVDVVTCPWKDDPIMDDPGIRKFLKAQLDTSVSEHMERGGVIYRLEATGNYIIMYSPAAAPPRSECTFPIGFPPPVEGYTLVGIWHTHPAKNSVLTNCPTRPPGSRTGAGPSAEDFKAQRDVNPASEYVMDRDDIYRIKNAPSRPWWYFWANSQQVLRKGWKSCPNWIS